MKIGVVTYVRTDNYGAELQGYALQHKLNMMGYDAEVLDIDKVEIDSATFREMAIKAIVKRIKRNPVSGLASVVYIAYNILKNKVMGGGAVTLLRRSQRESAFEEFWQNAIRHSEYIPIDELQNSELTKGYDALIAGSDQIWNYTRTSFLDPYFLTFAPEGTRKISYAASFSISNIPESRREQYCKLINNIDHISVREAEGVEIVRRLTGRHSELVLDPTLLLGKEEWLKVASDRIKIDEPYILTYSLNSSKAYWKIVTGYAKRYGLKIVNLRHDFRDNKIPAYQIDVFDAGPREFLYLIAHASLVITNSFHGTIFSINFNVPFLTVLNKVSETNSRIQSILNRLGLNERLMYDDNVDLNRPVSLDYTSANVALRSEIEKSLMFLGKNLD